MSKHWSEVGGRDDVSLAGDLPDLEPFRIDELMLLEADELGGPGQFPTYGDFAPATLLESGEEHYVQITEGLRDFVDELRGEEPVRQVAIDIDTAEKEAGEEGDELARWRYTGSVSPLGPPQDGENGP